MDKNIRIAVVLTICHVVSGRSYLPEFHHGYDYPQPGKWHNGPPGWDHQRPAHYQRDHKDFNPHKYSHGEKEFWHKHHSADSDSGSWEYPDFPSHGHPNFPSHGNPNYWGGGQQGWDNHERPNYWPQRPSNTPTWGENRPTTLPVNKQTTPGSTTRGSQDLLAITLCIRSCPVTSEFNPVCGSNNVTYSNPGRLECAKYCGVDVTLQRNSACPPPGQNITQIQNNTRPTQTTSWPTQTTRPTPTAGPTLKPSNPTRYTTIELPATDSPAHAEPNPPFTISPDILNSIFSTSTTTEDDNFDIDIRTRSRFQPRT